MSYVGRSDAERAHMLAAVGAGSFEDLLVDVPVALRTSEPLAVGPALSEIELRRDVGQMAARNDAAQGFVSFQGGGMYDHYIPSALPRVALRSEFMTAYTPYQPEVAQGTLQVIFEFQSMIAELTGLDMANASLYDGASAVVEAAYLARAHTGRKGVVVAGALHPHYRATLVTFLGKDAVRHVPHDGATGTVDPAALKAAVDADTACVLFGYPNFFGAIEDVPALIPVAHAAGALAVVAADPIALALLTPPGELGADLCVGEAQPLGAPMSFGGPACGFFAGKKEFARRFPGRIVGQTLDSAGRRGFVLTLQTREQHIRREKATSNICTNQGLIALMNTIYLSLLGKEGLLDVARLCFQHTQYLAQPFRTETPARLAFSASFVREFTLELPVPARAVILEGRKRKILLGVDGAVYGPGCENLLLVAATEKRTRDELHLWSLNLVLSIEAVQRGIA